MIKRNVAYTVDDRLCNVLPLIQGRSQDFTLGATEAERRRRENRGAKVAEKSRDWGGGILLSNRLGSQGEHRKLPQWGPGLSAGRQRILHI